MWVIADVFEYEAAQIHVGQAATYDACRICPGAPSAGRSSYILPQVDAATRTLKVRIEFANPDFALKPDMYGDVEFQTGGGAEPDGAADRRAELRATGRWSSWIAATGYFEPREVKIGRAVRRAHRNPQRSQSRRAHRDLRQLPDRFGKPVEDGIGRGSAK